MDSLRFHTVSPFSPLMPAGPMAPLGPMSPCKRRHIQKNNIHLTCSSLSYTHKKCCKGRWPFHPLNLQHQVNQCLPVKNQRSFVSWKPLKKGFLLKYWTIRQRIYAERIYLFPLRAGTVCFRASFLFCSSRRWSENFNWRSFCHNFLRALKSQTLF